MSWIDGRVRCRVGCADAGAAALGADVESSVVSGLTVAFMLLAPLPFISRGLAARLLAADRAAASSAGKFFHAFSSWGSSLTTTLLLRAFFSADTLIASL